MESWEKIVEIFEQAADLAADERPSFLARVCSSAEVRREVEAMLRADLEASQFIESPALAAAPTLLLSDDFLLPEKKLIGGRVGAYEIVREVGRGGMGTVFLAERRDTDFKQQVALKLVKRGMDTDFIVRRFRRERQILARLNHPNIARLLDGGTTEAGTPYFVMEYVEGRELLEFCERENLTLDERLESFCRICAAVAYAHQNLIVHRDLKPSNILVTGRGEPKLLDFGISKILTSDDDEQTGTATAFGLLTPKYAAPEQFRGEPATTATDVYSLGVILYELLTGNLPFDLQKRRVDEIAKIICESEPRQPSSVSSKITVSSEPSVESSNHTDSNRKLTTNPKSQIRNPKLLRGDLDNIILKALRKEPAQRYSSVEQLAEDIRRYRAGVPVSARPITFAYRASKFIQRNQIAVLAAIFILLTLTGGIAATVWQKRRAERRYEIARGLANNVLFKYNDELRNLPGSTRVREMLVKDAIDYLSRLQEDSAGDDNLRREIALAYFRVGSIQSSLYDNSADNAANALESYARALQIQEELLAGTPNDLRLRRQIGDTYSRQAESSSAKLDYRNALRSFENARRNFDYVRERDSTDVQSLLSFVYTSRMIQNMNDVDAQTRLGKARELLTLAEQGRRNAPDNANLEMMIALIHGDLASHLGLPDSSPLGRTDEAARHLETAARILRGLISQNPDAKAFYQEMYASLMMVAADIEIERGNVSAALENNREAVSITERRATAEPENANAKIIYVFALDHQARSLTAGNRLTEAEKVFRQAQKLFDDHKNLMETIPALVTLSINLNEDEGDLWLKRSNYAAALDSYRKAASAAHEYSRKMADYRPSESRNVARLQIKIGLAQSKIAASGNSGDQQKLLDEAAENFKQGIELYGPLAEKNLLSLVDLRVYETAQKELARFRKS
jgi:serine/threonine protein kinase